MKRFHKLVSQVEEIERDLRDIAQGFPPKLLCKQVEDGFRRRQKENIQESFARHATLHYIATKDCFGRFQALRPSNSSNWLISRENVREALKSLDVHIYDDKELHALFYQMDVDDNLGLDLNEFSSALKAPTPLSTWVRSLDLADVVVDALPRSGGEVHPLRNLSQLTDYSIRQVAQAAAEGLERLLKEKIELLRKAFDSYDDNVKKHEKKYVSASRKFEVPHEMECGSLEDFHKGLEGRIGSPDLDFLNVMRVEHCVKPGYDDQFETLNYRIKSTPEREWQATVEGALKLAAETDMRYGRRMCNLEELMSLPLTIHAGLSKSEVISVVLYTGPMYFLYNAALRRWPKEVFKKMEERRNLFATTIFVLVSAVQKIARVMPLSPGLKLYRGLGGTVLLPRSFYKTDKHGCRGFSEWAFMSTTASQEVAIKYSGVEAASPLPTVLVIRVGAVDRGACVKDFSQYPDEVEYLWVPGSFLEQDGERYLEVTSSGLVDMIPVQVNANLKTDTTEQLLGRKKQMHIAAFAYRVDEIEKELKTMAQNRDAFKRLDDDSTKGNYSVEGFIDFIVKQCHEILKKHKEVSVKKYTKNEVFQDLNQEMMDVKVFALSKLEEWLDNRESSFIMYRFKAALRTCYRRNVAFQERRLVGVDQTPAAYERLGKLLGLFSNDAEETNELMESKLMAAAADGKSSRVLEILVKAGAEVNRGRPDGVTAIWLAAQFGHVDCIRKLVELKADVNKAANNGATPAYTAAQSGYHKCIDLLRAFGADLNRADKDGLTPAHQAAMNNNVECIRTLARLQARLDLPNKKGETPLDCAKPETCKAELFKIIAEKEKNSQSKPIFKNLIISTGDISDVDGFMALAEYAKTGADVLFMMNYPGYVGVEEEDDQFDKENPGLGFKYSSEKVFLAVEDPPPQYTKLLERYPLTGIGGVLAFNTRMKAAMTDLAFFMSKRVWAEACEACGRQGGRFLFGVGGVNAVIPFSATAVKNELLVYAQLVDDEVKIDVVEGEIYDASGKKFALDVMNYEKVFLDFNGSMAFLNEDWQQRIMALATVRKLKGVFVMGGVRADSPPLTMPSIPKVLNRFSSATMNQLYHPQRTAALFKILSENPEVPVFTVSNNVVVDFLTFEDSTKKKKTLEGVVKFMRSNRIDHKFLLTLATSHYQSKVDPPRKAYDFYVAMALRKLIEEPRSLWGQPRRQMYYSEKYGLTLIANLSTWPAALENYVKGIDVTSNPADPPFIQTKKEYFVREIGVMRTMDMLPSLEVCDMSFQSEAETRLLKLVQAPRRLIISSGDTSDVDGFMALAEYVKSGADVMFVMNYPGYVGVEEDEDGFDEKNPGLGYKYSSEKVFEAVKNPPKEYLEFLNGYNKESQGLSSAAAANQRMKSAMTDMAFHFSKAVWEEHVAPAEGRAQLFFCVGGINLVNPFSGAAVKNELLVYAGEPTVGIARLGPLKEGEVLNSEGNKMKLDMLEDYDEVFLDFNGSMAFLSSSWLDKLRQLAGTNKLKGVFVMGGVLADVPPQTMPSIPKILNRFSCATMNQLYHPAKTKNLFDMLAEYPQVPVYTVTNNVVADLSTFDSEKKRTLDGVFKFMSSNRLDGRFLTKLAERHYDSPYSPPRKAFDFYVAYALSAFVRAIRDQNQPLLAALGPQAGADGGGALALRRLFYSGTYGVALVSAGEHWEEALKGYKSGISTQEDPTDPPFIRTKKACFARELATMDNLPSLPSLKVLDLRFVLDANTWRLRMALPDSATL